MWCLDLAIGGSREEATIGKVLRFRVRAVGTNSVIQNLKHAARGLPRFESLRIRVLCFLGKLDLIRPWVRLGRGLEFFRRSFANGVKSANLA